MKIMLPDAQTLDMFQREWYNILIYGTSGSGQTIFAGSWSDLGEVLFIDTDDGWLCLRTSNLLKHKSRIRRVPISDKSPDKHIKIPVGWLTVKGILNELDATGKFGDCKPVTVVLDSLSTAADYALDHVLYVNKHVGQQPTQPDWGKQMRELQDVIKVGKGGAFNFICIAHEQYQTDKGSGRTWCLPLVTGKLAGKLSQYFDETYHAVVHKEGTTHKYILETKTTGLITAKTRLDLPTEIPTTFESIYGAMPKPPSEDQQVVSATPTQTQPPPVKPVVEKLPDSAVPTPAPNLKFQEVCYMEDPWKHRSKGMRCKTCMFFVHKGIPGGNIGRCRRHAPTMKGYPVVFETDWCGDHKLDEVCGVQSRKERELERLNQTNKEVMNKNLQPKRSVDYNNLPTFNKE